MLLDIFHQGLLFFPFLLGPFLSYEVSGIPDLTVEGSYVLAVVIFASLINQSIPVGVALTIGVLGAGLAGVFVGVLQTKGSITPLLAGVLTLFLLQSGNLIILGKPYVSLMHLLSGDKAREMIFLSSVSLILVSFIVFILKSRFGLYLTCLKSHSKQLRKLGINYDVIRIGILTISNLIVGLAGVMAVHCYGYASTQMGQGQAIVSIGLVVIASEIAHFLKRNHIRPSALLSLGSLFGVNITYFGLTASLFRCGVDPLYLKLFVGAVFVFMLTIKGRIKRNEMLA